MRLIRHLATPAIFAATLNFVTFFLIPENGNVPCKDNCDSVRTVGSFSFFCFVYSAVATFSFHLGFREPENLNLLKRERTILAAHVTILVASLSLASGVLLWSVVLILCNQKVAGGLSSAVIGIWLITTMTQGILKVSLVTKRTAREAEAMRSSDQDLPMRPSSIV